MITCAWIDTSNAETGSFPWGVILLQVLLVAPKTLGRATAGKVWDAIADKVSKPVKS